MLRYIYLLLLRWRYSVVVPTKQAEGEVKAIRKFLETKTDTVLLLQSIVYLLDVVLDWITIETEYKHQESAPDSLVPLARTFAGIGTFMYLLDALDGVQWVVLERYRVSPLIITFANLLLEDIAQVVIAIYAAATFDKTLNAVWGLNLATSIFGILTRIAHCLEAKNEFTVPGLITLARSSYGTVDFLSDEGMEIDVPKLCNLYQKMEYQHKEALKKDVNEYHKVRTDMPGGVILVMNFIEEHFKENTSIEFKKGSFIDQQQINSLNTFRTKGLPVNFNFDNMVFDFRNCRIGNSATREPFSGPDPQLHVYKGSNALCLVSLLSFIDHAGPKKVSIWPAELRRVELYLGYLTFDIHTIKGLCKVLATNETVEHIIIYSVGGVDHISYSGEMIRGKIKDAVKDKTVLKSFVWKKGNEEIIRFPAN